MKDIGEPEAGYNFKYWTPFEKSCSDIKTIDSKQIVFNDYSTFYWEDLTEHERDITDKRPLFVFKSPLIMLYIYFDKTGVFSKKKPRQEFREFQSKLNELKIRTLDFS